MTVTLFWLSLAGAPVVGFIAGHVITYIHRAAAPRVVRLHSDDMAIVRSIERRLDIIGIRTTLIKLQGLER